MQRGTFQLMKTVNKKIILNKIRTSQPISRAQIAKETGLTPPTVSSIVKEVVDEGLVIESKLGESSGGRKPTMLHINSDAFYVIGVDAGPEIVECVLTDLTGKIYERTSSSLKGQLTNETFLNLLKENIYTILELSKMDQEKIIGIGVAMHGVVDVENGTSLNAPSLNLKNIPIKDELSKTFDLEIKVENDARAMALGESWFGGHDDVNSMVAVNIGRGVGAGVVINGELFHGAQDMAGEIGHMTIDLHGDVCKCGNRGCLQTFVIGDAIVKRMKERCHNLEEITAKEIYERALQGEAAFVQILEETGNIIGIGLTNLIHLINPSKIILGGGVMKSEKFLMPAILETIQERALTPKSKETTVMVTKLGDDATLLGAVALLLVELFDPV
ncbi:ROK family transcriptional regulator [Oceanobacillus sp. Castelsardo]|uniref:ROK family transcriptional regulator n=1 Tax=Oceanobacillus sp. Castelsardo TaxID=1851204 RepID=UPI000838D9D1|nr:ROK family transcriptional regulator [Oceanobacillus sp. Castelsardo]